MKRRGIESTMPKAKKSSDESKSALSRARRRLFFEEKKSKSDTGATENVDETLSQRKNISKSSLSGSPKKQDQILRTPEKRKSSKQLIKDEPSVKRIKTDEEKEYVPKYIHKNVTYLRKGEGDISDATKKTFDLVDKHFIIPKDLEQSRKYGPLSGTCFEERVISAYTLNLLEPRSKSSSSVAICSVCAVEGHRRNQCPTLI